MLLVALFRTEYKSVLEPLLDIHRERLEKTAIEKINNIKNALQTVSKINPSGWSSFMGEFAGTFVASSVHIHGHHQ